MKIICSYVFSLFLLMSNAFAATLPNANNLFKKANKGKISELVNQVDSAAGDALSPILALLYIIGIGLSVVVLTYIAIQIMIAPPQKKAEIKATLYPFFIGVIILMAGVPIAVTVIYIFTQVF